MTVLVALGLGLAAGWATWRALGPVLAGAPFDRGNHRGLSVPTAGGLVLPLAALVVAAAAALIEAVTGGTVTGAGGGGGGSGVPGGLGDAMLDRLSVLATVVGLALLGLVDDLAGSGADGRGFRGHLQALARGRLTTGGLKLVGGGALALSVCASVSGGGVDLLVVDALLVALAANLGNLFDRAPGRALKMGTLSFVVLALATGLPTELAGVAVVVGAALALAPADLGERVMLGDTGANALGGVLGLGLVLAATPTTKVVALVVVAGLNLAGEVVSFSRVIEACAPLRILDRAGRRP